MLPNMLLMLKDYKDIGIDLYIPVLQTLMRTIIKYVFVAVILCYTYMNPYLYNRVLSR